jgi:hypothetical protein
MRWAGVGAAIIAAADDALYLGVVNTQGGSNPQFLRAPFVAAFIGLMAICAALSSRASAARWRPLLLGVSAAGLLLLGFFGIFSIGLPPLVAGALASWGLISALGQARSSGETSVRAAVVMAVGGVVATVVPPYWATRTNTAATTASSPSRDRKMGGGPQERGPSADPYKRHVPGSPFNTLSPRSWKAPSGLLSVS